MELHFSITEMIAFLKRHKYVVRRLKKTVWRSVYHNDSESEELELWAVYHAGHTFCDPGHYDGEAWLYHAFETVLKDRIVDYL